MKRKSRALDFKKGDQVAYLTDSYEQVGITEGLVTLVRKDMPVKRWDGEMLTLPVVYVQFRNQYGHTWSHKFCEEFGLFQDNPRPLWKIRHLNNGELANLVKRAKHASKLHAIYVEESKRIEVDVDQEARDWKYRELDKRRSVLPHSGQYLNKVVALLGFKQPKSN